MCNNKDLFLFETPEILSSSIVVPTGKVSVCDNVITLEVWKDKKIENIIVNTEGTYPKVVTDGKLNDEYLLKLCAVVENDGVYSITSLGYATDCDGNYKGLNKDKPELLDETEITPENLFFIKNDFKPVSPFRRVDRYYQAAANKLYTVTKSYFLGDFSFGKYFFDITNWAGTRMKFDAGKTAFEQEFSKILVKYDYPDKASEWVSYDHTALPFIDQIPFKNISYIVSNNVDNGPKDESCMAGEDLVFLFGSVDAFEEKALDLTLGEKTASNIDASLFKTLRFRVKIKGELSGEDAVLTYERKDGSVSQRNFKLAMGGVDNEGYHVFNIVMREVQAWQNEISYITITLPEGEYELDYVKLLATGVPSNVKLGKAIPMFSDGNIEKGFFIGSMERGIPTFDDYFATKPGADKAREEYEASVKDDETKPDKMYPDWRMVPLYAYDYIGAYPYMKEAGFTYDSDPAERLASLKEADPEAYEKYYLDYLFEDNGEPDAEGFYRTADKAGAKEIVYKPNQKYTTTDGVERIGTVLEYTLNGSAMFKGRPYSKYDKNNNPDGTWRYWPHLLIEQNQSTRPVDFKNEIQYSTGADRLYCEFDIRLKNYCENYTKKTHPDGQIFDNGHMSFLLYSYLRPKSNPGTLVWFGLNIASDSNYITKYYDVNWCRDSGANTYMYCLAPEAVYSGFENSIHSIIQTVRKSEDYKKGTVISTDWIHVKVDLTHHVGIILDRINSEDAYGLDISTKDDWFFNGVNIGFETSDNVDCTFEMANFNFYSYNIED